MKKEHAEHNEKLSSELLKEGKYNDWVVTTAFYSALHFIEHKLFPLELDNTVYSDLGEVRAKRRCASKHSARKELVAECLPAQIANYDFLDKNCRNARYVNYVVSPKKANIAFQRLGQLKQECLETD